MKVTAQTTLGELAVLLGQYGVREMNGGIAPSQPHPYRIAIVYGSGPNETKTVGDGRTLPEALDDAFARVIHRSAHVEESP